MSNVYIGVKELGETYRDLAIKFSALLEMFEVYLTENELGGRQPSENSLERYNALFKLLNQEVTVELAPKVVGYEACGSIVFSARRSFIDNNEVEPQKYIEIYMNKHGGWALQAKEDFQTDGLKVQSTIDKTQDIQNYIFKTIVSKVVEPLGVRLN